MKKAYLQLHIAVFLWGFTAIIGKLISLDEVMLVWYRMLISPIALWIFLSANKNFHLPDRKTILKSAGIGIIICLHWITFYGAIKASNVSVAISCFSSLALFTSVLDALFKRNLPQFSEIIFSMAVIGGIYIIFSVQELFLHGILLSIVSAALAALFSLLNKELYIKHDPGSISVIELASGFFALTLFLPFYTLKTGGEFVFPGATDWMWLLLLSVVCTSLAFTLGNYALQRLDAFTCNLAVNLEPVYSIILAIIFFGEGKFLNSGFYIGTAIILLSVVVHTVYKYSKRKNNLVS